MLNLNIPAETERRIRDSALAAGQDIETFVLNAVEARLSARDSGTVVDFPADFDDWLAECVARHPQVKGFVDDSRASIYDERGE